MDATKIGSSVSLDEQAERIPYLRSMMSMHIASLTLAFFSMAVSAMLIVVASLALIVMVLMTMAAWREVGRGYAVRHLVLYVILTPLIFLGPIAVPFLVWSDLTKRRAAMADVAVDKVNDPPYTPQSSPRIPR